MNDAARDLSWLVAGMVVLLIADGAVHAWWKARRHRRDAELDDRIGARYRRGR